MIEIIKGTTPTIKYKFKVVDIDDIAEAIVTIKQNDTVLVRKNITDATVSTSDISWTLTQAETLTLQTWTEATIMCNWKTRDGTRGASVETKVQPTDNHIPEVI